MNKSSYLKHERNREIVARMEQKERRQLCPDDENNVFQWSVCIANEKFVTGAAINQTRYYVNKTREFFIIKFSKRKKVRIRSVERKTQWIRVMRLRRSTKDERE